jgi:L-asparaginase
MPIHINPALPNRPRASVLVIYTGGTLGMVYDRTAGNAGQLIPFDVEQVLERMPEIHRLDFEITLITLNPVLDSSNINPGVWVELARLIEREYARFDSFVILHGTDTMAYTASALSFMLGNLSKPVILTGAQLPIGAARTDARENFITALEIAAAVDAAAVDTVSVDKAPSDTTTPENNQPMVPEVCVYFNARLLRGNRSTKQESVHFNAFASENYPHLAQAGVTIDYNRPFIHRPEPGQRLTIRTELDTNVTILKLFPGITEPVVRAMLGIPGLRGLVLETFGAGNAPTDTWFLDALHEAIERGMLILNVSQCEGGRVTQGQYQTSNQLRQIGVVSGADITTEAAITKLMFVLGQSATRPGHDPVYWRAQLAEPICGEMTAQPN